MDIVTSIAQLLAGLGAFLLGFKVLSDNIEKLANRGLKKLFSKTQNNRFIGVGIGVSACADICSAFRFCWFLLLRFWCNLIKNFSCIG